MDLYWNKQCIACEEKKPRYQDDCYFCGKCEDCYALFENSDDFTAIITKNTTEEKIKKHLITRYTCKNCNVLMQQDKIFWRLSFFQ